MRIILILIALPIILFLIPPPATQQDENARYSVFDTTMIEGYSFFHENGIDITLESNIEFYNTLYPLIGIPHRSRAGRDGLDCSGLVKKVFNSVFGTQLKGGSRDIFRQVNVITTEELRETDLLFFKINSSQINHMGIYLNNDKFVHSSAGSGVVIEDFSKNYYQQHFYKAGRLTH